MTKLIREQEKNRKPGIRSVIKVIGFDLDDTLWAVRPIILRAEKQLNAWLIENVPTICYTVAEMSGLRQSVLQETPGLINQITELRRRIIEKALLDSAIGVTDARQLSNQAMAVFLEARNQIDFFDGALEAISDLAGSYVLGALTNGNADITRMGLQPYFSFAFSAEQVGAPKPAPNLFTHALEHTSASPDQMIYVGDDPVLDIDTANRLGLHTIWINRQQSRKQGQTVPDVTISKRARSTRGGYPPRHSARAA